MARKKGAAIEEATPLPVEAQFRLNDSLVGALSGNARNGEARLDLYCKDAESGVSHVEVDGIAALARLAQQLCDFLDAMQSRGSH